MIFTYVIVVNDFSGKFRRVCSHPGQFPLSFTRLRLQQASQPGSTTSSQPSITKLHQGLKTFSLAKRKPVSGEDTWGGYGLNLLYEPPDSLVDLVFVHGLRGGSVKTWCKGDDLKRFWPQAWLPRERELQNARVHSFGYDADWANIKETALDLHDFGRALLTELNTSPLLRRDREVIDIR